VTNPKPVICPIVTVNTRCDEAKTCCRALTNAVDYYYTFGDGPGNNCVYVPMSKSKLASVKKLI